MKGEFSENEPTEPIEHAVEVFPGGWRLNNPEAGPNVPASWFMYNGQDAYIIDPGGELPIVTPEDKDRIKSIAALAFGIEQAPKIHAIQELAKRYGTDVKAILLTHGDADHTNNIEDISGQETPIYVGLKGRWKTLSPEKQFAASVVNRRKSSIAGNQPHDMYFRDLGMRLLDHITDHLRSGPDRVEKKRALAKRFSEYPESFSLAGGEMQVIPAPGHAPEEVGFYLPDRKIFIGGDLIQTGKPEQAGRLNLFLSEANVYQALESLQHLKTMDIEQFYPAHGPPLIGHEIIQERIQILEKDARGLIDRTLHFAKEHPQYNDEQLRRLVFSPDWQMKDMAKDSERTWIFSILRDRPPEPGN